MTCDNSDRLVFVNDEFNSYSWIPTIFFNRIARFSQLYTSYSFLRRLRFIKSTRWIVRQFPYFTILKCACLLFDTFKISICINWMIELIVQAFITFLKCNRMPRYGKENIFVAFSSCQNKESRAIFCVKSNTSIILISEKRNCFWWRYDEHNVHYTLHLSHLFFFLLFQNRTSHLDTLNHIYRETILLHCCVEIFV